MENTFIYIIVVAVIGGIAAFLINGASFIEAQFKQIAIWLILAAVLILIALRLLALV